MIFTSSLILFLAKFSLSAAKNKITGNEIGHPLRNLTEQFASDINKKIYGGDWCGEKQSTQVVMLVHGMWNSFCSGSLLNPWTVLTAAMCYTPRLNITVVAGYTYDLQYQYVQRSQVLKVHLGWNYHSVHKRSFDIAIFSLNKPIYQNYYVTYNKYSAVKEFSSSCHSGAIKDLRKRNGKNHFYCTEIPLVNSSECVEKYSVIADNIICGSGMRKKICRASVGGPLMCEGVQIGILVWTSEKQTICSKEHPVVFVRTDAFTDFIALIIETIMRDVEESSNKGSKLLFNYRLFFGLLFLLGQFIYFNN